MPVRRRSNPRCRPSQGRRPNACQIPNPSASAIRSTLPKILWLKTHDLEQKRAVLVVRNLPLDSLACLEQRLYCASEFWPSVGQLRGAHGKHIHLCLADHKPEVLEEPADLVLNIPLDLDEQSPADKKGFDRVTVVR